MSLWRSEFPRLTDPNARICIVAAEFNSTFVEPLLEQVVRGLKRCGVDEERIDVLDVPGSFELPFACRKAALSGQYDAVIALGVIIRGETFHFELVANQAAEGIMRINLEAPVPVIFGVLACDNSDQVEARIELGLEFAKTAVRMIEFDGEFANILRSDM